MNQSAFYYLLWLSVEQAWSSEQECLFEVRKTDVAFIRKNPSTIDIVCIDTPHLTSSEAVNKIADLLEENVKLDQIVVSTTSGWEPHPFYLRRTVKDVHAYLVDPKFKRIITYLCLWYESELSLVKVNREVAKRKYRSRILASGYLREAGEKLKDNDTDERSPGTEYYTIPNNVKHDALVGRFTKDVSYFIGPQKYSEKDKNKKPFVKDCMDWLLNCC
eukprot:784785_1